MRCVVGIAFLALVAQAAEQAANNTAAGTDDDADLNELLSNMDDETMDKVADKLIDKLLGNLTGMFNLDGQDLDTTELFKNLMPSAITDGKQPTEEEQAQIEQAAAAEAGVAAALAAAAAETAVALAEQLQELQNNPDALNEALLQYLPEDYDRDSIREDAGSDFAPHAEDVCEGQNFNQEECQAQGAGCCFWENNACWAAVDGACQTADQATELDQVDEEAPDLATVVFVGVASVIVGSASTYALLRPRFRSFSDKQLPLLTPA